MSKPNKLVFALISASLSTLAFAGCIGSNDGTATSRSLVIQQDCATSTPCPAGFECEVEDVTDTTTTSFCQSDDDSGGTCPAGYELEVEHGQAFCKPHGGSGGSGGSGSGSSGSDDGAGDDHGHGSDDGAGDGHGHGHGHGGDDGAGHV